MEKNILALDLGKGSIGIALSRSGSFITALPEKRFKAGEYEEALEAVKAVAKEEKVESIVIGWPTYPSGDPCEMTPIVSSFIEQLKIAFPSVPIHPVDERNSTVEAAARFHESGQSAKKQKKKIDSGAASIILERYLRSIGQY
ncbi:MAG: Holliday junction resolvase RuvX [Erysipelotrichaceae bacterium]|nr:Holliday junction resolvase RuvX [Erysipelotrichaceae bacterium]